MQTQKLEGAMKAKVLERYFDALRNQDWECLGECLATDVHRNGPYLDVVRGRDAYVEFLAGVIPTLPNYELRVHSVRELEDGAVVALLSEILDVQGVRTEIPEALIFGFDPDDRIATVDIYLKQIAKGGSQSADRR